MPTIPGRITAAKANSCTTDKADEVIWEGSTPGFGLRIRRGRAGRITRAWLVQYRDRSTGETRRRNLGKLALVSPHKAREEAKRLLSEAQLGRDPVRKQREARERREAAKGNTVRAVYERWAEEKSRLRWKPTTEREARRIFQADILPVIGKLQIAEVDKAAVKKVLATKAGSPVAQNRILAWLSALLEWAAKEELRSGTNPCKLIEWNPEKPRERSFSLAELAAIGEALRDRPDAEQDAVDAIMLLALTGLRRDEVLALRWDEVSVERRLLALTDTKTGGRLKALGPEALAILRRRRKASEPGAVWAFPAARGDGHRRDIRQVVWSVYESAGIKDATAHHVFRHSFTTHAAELGFAGPIISSMVGHRDGSMTGRYTHLAIDGIVRQADEKVQARIARALAGKTAKVLAMKP